MTAWDRLFAARAGRTDCLLVDALRARAVRLYPRDEERQDSAVTEFWSHLLVSETPGSVPVLGLLLLLGGIDYRQIIQATLVLATTALAAQLDADAATSTDGAKVRTLAATLRDLASASS